MVKQILILSGFILLDFLTIHGQNVPNSTIDKAVEEVINGAPYQKLKNHNNNKIIVMPIKNPRGQETDYSRILSNKLAHELGLRISGYSVVSFEKDNDPALVKLLEETRLRGKDAVESERNKEMINKSAPDYIVTGDYTTDANGNEFKIENVQFENNWVEGAAKEIIPFNNSGKSTDGKVGLYRKYGLAFIPGGRQLYKKQKTKGALLLSGTLLLAAGTGISHAFYSVNYTQATQTTNIELRRAYLEDSQAWETSRNVCAIGAGALYLYNIIDAFVSKGNKNNASENYSFKVTPSQTEMGMAVSVNF